MNNLKSLVLKHFKSLHRTRIKVFSGDVKALTAARLKINSEFNKHKHETNEETIKSLIKLSEAVELELRTQVIQAKEVRPNVYEVRITKDTEKLDNIEFDDFAKIPTFTKGPCKNQNK